MSMKNRTKQLNVALPENIYNFTRGQAMLSGMKIREFTEKALIEYGKKLEAERESVDEIIELQLIPGRGVERGGF